MGKDGKKKSKDRSHDEEEPASAAATRSVSVKILKEDADASGCMLVTLLPVSLHVSARSLHVRPPY